MSFHILIPNCCSARRRSAYFGVCSLRRNSHRQPLGNSGRLHVFCDASGDAHMVLLWRGTKGPRCVPPETAQLMRSIIVVNGNLNEQLAPPCSRLSGLVVSPFFWVPNARDIRACLARRRHSTKTNLLPLPSSENDLTIFVRWRRLATRKLHLELFAEEPRCSARLRSGCARRARRSECGRCRCRRPRLCRKKTASRVLCCQRCLRLCFGRKQAASRVFYCEITTAVAISAAAPPAAATTTTTTTRTATTGTRDGAPVGGGGAW